MLPLHDPGDASHWYAAGRNTTLLNGSANALARARYTKTQQDDDNDDDDNDDDDENDDVSVVTVQQRDSRRTNTQQKTRTPGKSSNAQDTRACGANDDDDRSCLSPHRGAREAHGLNAYRMWFFFWQRGQICNVTIS
jgi:hypothetical protein